MKKKMAALVLASATALSVGALLAGCNKNLEPVHATHYDADANGICDKCNVDMEGHAHIFSKKWESDATHHWHKTTCGHPDAIDGKAEHTYASNGKCSVCLKLDDAPVKSVNGLYTFQAEFATLKDAEGAAANKTMVIEWDKTEFTESGKTDGAKVSEVGYFGTAGHTITWTFTAAQAGEVTLTVRMASADGTWTDLKINEIELGSANNKAPTLAVNGTNIDLTGKKLKGLSGLKQSDMQSGTAYSNYTDIVVTVNLVAGENNIVLTAGETGANVDKITIATNIKLEFVNTDNSARPSNHS